MDEPLVFHRKRRPSTAEYLERIGVRHLGPKTCAFDPGYDPVTLEAHLFQSGHLIEILKLSMACWQVASEAATRRKLAAAAKYGVPTVTGGGPFEVAVVQGELDAYLDLVSGLGFDRIEAGEGFTDTGLDPDRIVGEAGARGLEVQFELGKKHGGAFSGDVAGELIEQGRRWLDAGAAQLVVEARENARGVGLFDAEGRLDTALTDRFVSEFGLDVLVFEAPNKASQFAFMDHLGPGVRFCNVRLEEILRVEIYRRGLHSDAFSRPNLRPARPERPAAIPAGDLP